MSLTVSNVASDTYGANANAFNPMRIIPTIKYVVERLLDMLSYCAGGLSRISVVVYTYCFREYSFK